MSRKDFFLSFFLSSFLRRTTTTSKSCVSTVSVFRLRRVDDELNAGKRFFLFSLSSDSLFLTFQRRKGFCERDFS